MPNSPSSTAPPAPKPPWLKVPLPGGEGYAKLKGLTRRLGLNTVCEEARCPNVGECWKGEHATMTIMVLGDECTRRCRFCAVRTVDRAAPPNPDEPAHVGQAVGELSLDYVVLTSVDRDDLADGGASHYAECVRQVRAHAPSTIVETLIPDYAEATLAALMAARPDVLAHNVEVVDRLRTDIKNNLAILNKLFWHFHPVPLGIDQQLRSQVIINRPFADRPNQIGAMGIQQGVLSGHPDTVRQSARISCSATLSLS